MAGVEHVKPHPKLESHPMGTQWNPTGTIRVYAFKYPLGGPQKKKIWELVLRTDKKLIADRVQKCWMDNGFDTRREE